MIRYRVDTSPESEKDYDDIVNYIVAEFGDVSAAINIGRKLQAKINSLDTFPMIATIREEPELHKRRIRTVQVEGYSILYRIDTAHHVVEIVRITYGRRDLGRLFKNT